MLGIVLSYDDGPSNNATERILDTLESCGCKAVFFPIGENIRGREHLLRRMVDLGCQVGNHTWEHEYMSQLSPDNFIASITRTNEAVFDACGVRPVLLRPPGGVVREETVQRIRELGMSIMLWNVDPRDWKTRDYKSTVDHVVSKAAEGKVVIMHDLYEEAADAAEILIPKLIRKGYRLSTVSELAVPYGGLIPGKKYYGF